MTTQAGSGREPRVWLVRLLVLLGPTFFEAVSVALLAVGLNVLTSQVVGGWGGASGSCSAEGGLEALCWLSGLVGAVAASLVSKEVNSAFSVKETPEGRGAVLEEIEMRSNGLLVQALVAGGALCGFVAGLLGALVC